MPPTHTDAGGLPPVITFVDLETTGGNAIDHRIIEIACIRLEHGVEVARQSSLIRPDQPIPPFIQRLTGISPADVADAPTFAEYWPTVAPLFEGAVFAAHNARFDYGFLRQSCAQIGYGLRADRLCTVLLSRALYPQFRKHSLSTLVQRFNITLTDRHRALADTSAIVYFYLLWAQEFSPARFAQAVRASTRKDP